MAAEPGAPRLEFHFLGVSTAGSSALRMFPAWMRALNRPDVELVGVDLPLHAREQLYRRAVAEIRENPMVAGGLVTTHKIDLLNAARDLFDELDPYARLCGEVNTIAKEAGRLTGYATDPVAGGVCLDKILGTGYFGRTGGHVLCLGAGGAGTALALTLAAREDSDRPARIMLADRLASRLAHAKKVLEKQGGATPVDYVESVGAVHNDALMAELPAGSLVINATGMGKDRPGSPISGAALFPEHGIAWELNYRGELVFLQQAREQQPARGLAVYDGWDYFVHGWATVISRVLSIDINEEMLGELAELAAAVR